MGAVYRARRTLLGDEVAIKVVRQDSPDPSSRERFLHESRIAARLRHPSIVSIFDFDMPPGSEPYLVMELLSGPSVAEEIAARGRLELGDVQRIVPGICSALQLAHAHGVVHRDIKPANIVAHDYDAGPRVYKLVDFGIANLRRSTIETRLTSLTRDSLANTPERCRTTGASWAAPIRCSTSALSSTPISSPMSSTMRCSADWPASQ